MRRSTIPTILVGQVDRVDEWSARLSERFLLSVDYFGDQYPALALFSSPEKARSFLARHGCSGWGVWLLDSPSMRSCLEHEHRAVAAVIDPPDLDQVDVAGFFILDIVRAISRAASPDELILIRVDLFRLLAPRTPA
ncbi:MAG TPA: hypothetical protein VML55_07730 [Planctomycetaceae bacterium]|nr:hypothetical protein [Planctomycetaceae bacterium]